MLKRLMFVSAIAVGGSLAIAPYAQANTVDIPFDGSVTFECAFGAVTPGVLVPVGSPATVLSSTAAGGVAGTTDILCNGAAAIDITAVTKAAGPAFAPVNQTVTVNGNPGLPVAAGVLTDLFVNLEVEAAEPLPVGDYSYFVTLTAVPN